VGQHGRSVPYRLIPMPIQSQDSPLGAFLKALREEEGGGPGGAAHPEANPAPGQTLDKTAQRSCQADASGSEAGSLSFIGADLAVGSFVTTSRLRCYAETRQVLPGSQSRRCEAHRRGQPLQSGARNAKNAPESAICGVLPNRPAPTGSVPWLVPISNPRSAPRRVARINLRSDALRLWRSPPPSGSPPPHPSRKRPWCSE
jgi:hypothetical protein